MAAAVLSKNIADGTVFISASGAEEIALQALSSEGSQAGRSINYRRKIADERYIVGNDVGVALGLLSAANYNVL